MSVVKRIGFKTFGCKANSVDTDVLVGEASRRGFEIVADHEMADAYIINSCTVTHGADRDARSQIHRFKRANPGAVVGIVGCYSQVAKGDLLALPDVNFVVGTSAREKILDCIEGVFEGKTAARDQVVPATGFLNPSFPGSRNARASIKIQDGCNFRCSFCIIPEARGRSQSLSANSVLRQVDEAYEQGFQEVILTGIHLAHYGWDKGTNLLECLSALLKKKGPRIRLSTLDPFEIPEALVNLVAYEPRMCPHFHIALQSGSDAVLRSMRRIYRVAEFCEVARKIYEKDRNIFVGVDVIVGFPGESEERFLETLSVLKDTPWTKLHVFSYSDRKGTRASSLPDRVSPSVIGERSRILREMSEGRYRAFLSSQVGTDRNVLLERRSSETPDTWYGHSENYVPVKAKVMGETKQIVNLRLASFDGKRLAGVTL